HVLGIAQLDDGPRLKTALGLDARKVSNPEILELPHELNAHIVTPYPLVETAVGPKRENSALNQHAGALEAVEHDQRQERARLLPANPGLCRLNERPPRSDLGAIGQGD